MTIAAVESENPRPRMVALKRKDKPLEMMPTPETQIEPDDLLVAIGESHSLKRLALLRSTSESLRTAGPDRMKANFIVRTAPKSAGGLARAPIVGQRCLF